MANTFHCDIVSARREIFSGRVTVLSATGVAGELGIYPQHAPLFTQLKPGPVRVWDEAGEEQCFVVSGGFLEVQSHLVTVMADTAARGEEFDMLAEQAARAEAERELATRSGIIDLEEAETKLLKALAELRGLDRLRKTAQR